MITGYGSIAWMPEIDLIKEILCLKLPEVAVELGIWEGHVCEFLKASGIKRVIRVDLFDNYKGDFVGGFPGKLNKKPDLPGVEILQMGTAEAARLFKDQSIDFLLIDADHSYEGVKRDYEAWKSKIRSGGILLFHDYNNPKFPGVKKYVDSLNLPIWKIENYLASIKIKLA